MIKNVFKIIVNKYSNNFRRVNIIISIISFIVCLNVFYPGSYTPDGYWSLMQINGYVPFNDWHPPIIQFVWSILWKLFQSNQLLWLTQLTLFTLLVLKFSKTIKNSLLSTLTIVVLLLFPPLSTSMSIFWKDSWYIIWGLGMYTYLFNYLEKKKILDFIISIIFLVLFILTRYNAFIVVFPFLYIILITARSNPIYRWKFFTSIKPKLRSIILVISIVSMVIVTQMLISKLFVNLTLNSWQLNIVYDLTGISVNSNKLVFPQYILEGKYAKPPTLNELKEIYKVSTADSLLWRADNKFIFPITNQVNIGKFQVSNNELKELVVVWIKAIISNPKDYLKHRLLNYNEQLGLTSEKVCAPYHHGINLYGVLPNIFDWKYVESPNNKQFFEFLDKYIANSIIFRGYFYLIVTVILLFWFIFKRDFKSPESNLIYSSILVFFSNMFLLTSCDFRYILWPVIAIIMSLFWLIDKRITIKS